jgi:hypothetical protein
MNEVLTLAEIHQRFPSEWVLLGDPQTDESLEVLGGTVLCHSKERDEVDRQAIELAAPKDLAILYTGPELPDGMEAVL